MKKKILIISAVVLLVGVLVCVYFVFINKDAQTSAGGEYWPSGEWRTSTPEEQGMDSAVLANMISSVKDSGKNINSITIIRNGYLVNETYFYPYQKGYKHAVNSVTKSFISALTGIALKEGKIKSLEDKVLDYFPGSDIANIDARKQNMKLQNLLSMTTGLDWQFQGNVSTNDMTQSADWAKFTLDLPMKEEPGLTFNYCNGAAEIMSSVLQKATGKTAADLFSEKFSALGIKDMYWQSSPENASMGYSGIFMTPDDAAKFGYLYLENGKWNGRQIVPQDWIEESTKQHSKPDWNKLFTGYGYMWWLPSFGGYAAMGYGGDYIFVVPDSNLIVVFTSGMFNDTDLFYPAELMDKYVIHSVKSDSPLPGNSAAFDILNQAAGAVQNAPLPKSVTLPDTAARISGKTYLISDSSTLEFDFSGGSEFTFVSNSNRFTAGLDGDFRTMDVGNNGSLPDHSHWALKGEWLDNDTLQVDVHMLEDGYVFTYTVHFEGDTAQITLKTNLGSEQNLTGKVQ